MTRTVSTILTASLLTALMLCPALAADPATQPSAKKPARPYRLPGVERMSQVLWGSECETPDGQALRFGGEDQKSDDGCQHTEIKVDGQWKPIIEELRKANPAQPVCEKIREAAGFSRRAATLGRSVYFAGKPADQAMGDFDAAFKPLLKTFGDYDAFEALAKIRDADAYLRSQVAAVEAATEPAPSDPPSDWEPAPTVDGVHHLWRSGVRYEQVAELLDCEPAPRALSPIVYDAKSKLFVIFGGDHLDYLTNDTWVFDPAKKRWEQRHPKAAPAPRANHKLAAAGDGKIKLSGGYTYWNDIDYMGGPYIDIDDGDWTYDAAANTWTSDGGKEGVEPNQRVYRTGPFHPDFFMQGDKPDAAAFGAKLKDLPANTWVATGPPRKPRVNRDWGTAVIDPDHDVMLRWSGGHCAHGGSDVPMFHFATNRWELPFPVEFPLGQCYSNTSYPGGFNFNRRPWVTGHTYKGYDYDPASRQMVFVGHNDEFFIFDPAVGDWVAKLPKPKGMIYGGCFYDLLCKRTSDAVVCWTKNGQLFKYDGKARQWNELKTTGEKLPGSSVDSAGIDYDAKRDRVLLFPAKYGDKAGYNGQIVAVDLKELKATKLDPAGAAKLAEHKLGFLRETCYHAGADLVVCGSNIVQPDGGFLTPAYDCAANKWVTLKLAGPNPAGKNGRNVSMGFMFDAKRGLIWSVDTNGNIHVLRLDAKSADVKEL